MQQYRPYLVVTDSAKPADDLSQILRDAPVVCCAPASIGPEPQTRFSAAIVDLDLDCLGRGGLVRTQLNALRHLPNLYIVPASKASLVGAVSSIGATDVVIRPFSPAAIAARMKRLPLRRASAGQLAHSGRKKACGPASAALLGVVEAGSAVLQKAFDQIACGENVQLASFREASTAVVGGLVEATANSASLSAWLDTVRDHHSATFRHCLTVTANSVLFGIGLGVRRSDLERLAIASLVHDLGKASIPLEILDKPARLAPAETEKMRHHPEIGRNILLKSGGNIPEEVIQVVMHHHEYLDGSGYPSGLKGGQIPDIVRIVTIADVFTALVEDRPYKPGMGTSEALNILDEMAQGGKVDSALLLNFRKMVEGQEKLRS